MKERNMKKLILFMAVTFAVSFFLVSPATAIEMQYEAELPGQPLAGQYYADTMIGKTIVSSDGVTLGEVENLVLLSDGSAYLQLSSGGIFDIGEKYTMIPWRAVDNVTRNNVLLSLQAHQVQNAPIFHSEELGPGWDRQINSYYGEEAVRARDRSQREYYGEEGAEKMPPRDGYQQDEFRRGRPWWR
jgi:sporulation protein YlmC with PRC-barrel domain